MLENNPSHSYEFYFYFLGNYLKLESLVVLCRVGENLKEFEAKY